MFPVVLRLAALAVVLCATLAPLPDVRAQDLVAPHLPQAAMLRLQTIMIPLIQRMEMPIPLDQVQVKIINDKSINAAGSEDGQFFVTTGLLDGASDDRLRAILAHEIAAADLARLKKEGKEPDDRGGGLIQIARRVISGGSEASGDPADAHAVTLLRGIGKDGKTMMIDALRWLAQKQSDSDGFFATRPPSPERIEALRRLR
jgi:Zn-dependent protease with chaperone function